MTLPKATFDTAFAKHQAGDIGGAAQLYRDVLGDEPNHPEALHMLGIIAEQTQKPGLALELMNDDR